MTTVLHSCPVWLPRTQTWLYSQVSKLPADVVSHIVCDHVENRAEFDLPNIHSLADEAWWRQIRTKGLRWLRVPDSSGIVARLARTLNPGILHSHFGNVGWADMVAARQARLRHVVSFYGFDVNQLPRSDPRWRRRYQDLFRQVDAVLCEGPHMGAAVVALGCPEPKLHVHRLGVDIDAIPFKPFDRAPGEPLRVLMAASFREKKGIPTGLAALARLRDSIGLEITLIGDAGPEPGAQSEKAAIHDAIRENRLEPSIRMLGYQPHSRLMEEARAHHVFLSPSVTAGDGDTEGGAPVSLIDMAASGMLVVSTRHCDIPEIIRDGETGLLADERDVDGLVTKLEWLVAHPEAWAGIRKAARLHVETHFSASVQAEQLAKLYRTLIA